MADPHSPIHELRDPIHGFVKLTAAELRIINTPTFQRLRDIRQLAVAHLVYPGAGHSRFEHSIGCLHLSDQILDLLVANQARGDGLTFADALSMSSHDIERARGILRLAALLHDLGHPPFSHSGEYLLPAWSSATSLGQPPAGRENDRVTHEDMTAHLIRNSEIAEVIDRFYGNRGITVEDVVSVAVKPGAILGGRRPDPLHWVLHEILTWDFGTDRMDYLLRDAHHSGQPTGFFDYHKLLDSMALIADGEKQDRGGIRLGLDGSGWLVAEQMVVARYLMYISLYFHKTKRIYEKHVERFLPAWLAERFGGASFPVDVATYTTLTESAVMADIASAGRDPSHPGHADARPFLDRTHFRLAKELVLSDNARETLVRLAAGSGPAQEVLVQRFPDKKRLDSFHEWVNISFGKDAIIDTADHSATKMFSPGTEVLVLLDGERRYLGDLSEIVRGMATRVWRSRVYAPASRRDEVKKACNKWLETNPTERTVLDVKARTE